MKKISTENLKKRCLQVVDEIQNTGEVVLVAKNGEPVIMMMRSEAKKNESIFGYMTGKAKIIGDIVSPACPLDDWETLK